MVKEGFQTIIFRDCGSNNYCDNFECKNNYDCKCRYCADDMCNTSSVNLKKNIVNSLIISSLICFSTINYA